MALIHELLRTVNLERGKERGTGKVVLEVLRRVFRGTVIVMYTLQ